MVKGQTDENSSREQLPVATRTRSSSATSSINANHSDKPISMNSYHRSNCSNSSKLRSSNGKINQLVKILEKEKQFRTSQELSMLEELSSLVPIAEDRIKAKSNKTQLDERIKEQEEPFDVVDQKVDYLLQLMEESDHIVMYTGAGISTSASIPDYRGPNGLWTQIKRTGSFSITQVHDLSAAEPTYTHMAIKELCRRRIVDHVVSQNCDGLHLRSGIRQSQLSEIHGNMYIEVCPTCEKQYFRLADTTQRTCRFRHKTGRKCHTCPEPNNNLVDTIVLYGERSRTVWPMNWDRATKAAKKADLIICIGSSLKTLCRYNCLWPKTLCKPSKSSLSDGQTTKLAIINLQYTQRDRSSSLKINAKCDLVMKLLMNKLDIFVPEYDWMSDPMNQLAIPFTPKERVSLNRKLIFESKWKSEPATTPSSSGQHFELSESPSLFVSELSDDPQKKNVKMRIRARNFESEAGLCSSGDPGTQDGPDNLSSEKSASTPNDSALASTYVSNLPGWLGKSLGSSRQSTYRRKRHGNKGKKRLKKTCVESDSPANHSLSNSKSGLEGDICSPEEASGDTMATDIEESSWDSSSINDQVVPIVKIETEGTVSQRANSANFPEVSAPVS